MNKISNTQLTPLRKAAEDTSLVNRALGSWNSLSPEHKAMAIGGVGGAGVGSLGGAALGGKGRRGRGALLGGLVGGGLGAVGGKLYNNNKVRKVREERDADNAFLHHFMVNPTDKMWGKATLSEYLANPSAYHDEINKLDPGLAKSLDVLLKQQQVENINQQFGNILGRFTGN